MSTHNRVKRTWYACAYISLFSIMLAFYAPPEAPKDQSQDTLPKVELPNPDTLVLGKVVRVFDGDTLLIRIGTAQHRYQLLGVAAPQLRPNDRTPDQHAYEAHRFLELLLLEEQVYIQLDPLADRDVNNQRIVYIFRAPDMLFVNLELVRQGYAKHAPRYTSLYTQAFKHYNSRAKELDRGIWGPDKGKINWALQTSDPENTQSQPQLPTSTTNTPQNTSSTKPLSATQHDSNTIYITKSGKSYHTEDCSHLTDSASPSTREQVSKTHQPCKTCKPNDTNNTNDANDTNDADD